MSYRKYIVISWVENILRYGHDTETVPKRHGTDTVRYGAVRYGTDTVRYGHGTVRTRYGTDTVRYGHGTVRTRYGTDYDTG